MNQLLLKTQNGRIFKCSDCSTYAIEFKNLNFTLTKNQFLHFVNYFKKIDGEYWEDINQNSQFIRKIIVPIGKDGFNFCLNRTELVEFKELLGLKSKKSFAFQEASYEDLFLEMNLN